MKWGVRKQREYKGKINYKNFRKKYQYDSIENQMRDMERYQTLTPKKRKELKIRKDIASKSFTETNKWFTSSKTKAFFKKRVWKFKKQ